MKYDRSKEYSWQPEDRFEITGVELGVLSQTFRAILGTPEAAKILLAQQGNMAIEEILSRGVEAGVVKETVPPAAKKLVKVPDGPEPPEKALANQS